MLVKKETLQGRLPRVGDVLWERPAADTSMRHDKVRPQRCVVIEVNPSRLWYRVRFDAGFVEAFKIPRIREDFGLGGDSHGKS